MDEMLLTFNENGELEMLPEFEATIHFETEKELDEFSEFLKTPDFTEAFEKWKEGGAK